MLFGVLPIDYGGSLFVFLLLCITLCHFCFAIILKRKREDLVSLLLLYKDVLLL